MSVASVLARLLLTLGLFRLLGLPLARLLFPGLPRTRYALATSVALVLAVHATWLLVQAGLALGPLSVGLGMGLVALASLLARARGRAAEPRAAPASWRERSIHHIAFTLAFVFALLVTARNPSVDPDSERPMDYAMMNAVLASRSLPLEDPWMARERVSYYDYGYYALAYLSLFTGSPETFFPVSVALVYASLLAGVLALGRDLGGSAGGLLAAWLVCVGGNLEACLQTLRNGLEVPLDWFQAARVVNGGITEFPFFTLLWGDPHPYALALPLWPLLLAFGCEVLLRTPRAIAVALAGVSYAVLLATHTWDAVPVAAFLGLGGLAAARRERNLAPLGAALAVPVLGSLLALPFVLHLPTGGRGFGRVAQPSSLGQLACVWGVPAAFAALAALVGSGSPRREAVPLALLGFAAAVVVAAAPAPGIGLAVVATGLALVPAFAGRRAPAGPGAAGWLMLAVGFALVAGAEELFVDDFYVGDLERMNTVFKTYVEAWVLVGLGGGVLLGAALGGRAAGEVAAAAGPVARAPGRKALRRLAWGAVAAAVLATAVYPVRATPSRAGSLLAPIGLDARLAIRQLYPDDARAIEALKGLPRGVILEATGDPYSWYGRFATFTGYPAVVGWGHHEAGWRNTWEPTLERNAAVQHVYTAPGLAALGEAVKRYGVRYVVVGNLERSLYSDEALAKFQALEAVVEAGATRVYEVRP